MLVAVGLVALGVVFYRYNPYEHDVFPKCPFYVATGYQCPGCGSQRALHSLTHLDLGSAFRENFLMVLSIPYLLMGFFFEYVYTPASLRGLRARLYGKYAAWIAFSAIVGWWILRNFLPGW